MADSTRRPIWIPSEILQIIAQDLPVKYTYRFAQACRRFYTVLIDNLYRKALLEDEERGCPFRTLVELRLRNISIRYASLLKTVDNINRNGIYLTLCHPREICKARLRVKSPKYLPFFDTWQEENTVRYYGSTLLHALAALGDEEGVRLLFEERDDVSVHRPSPLLSAILRGYTPVVQRLLEAGMDPNGQPHGTPILVAIAFNQTHIIPLLLKHNASIRPRLQSENLMSVATEHGTLQTVKHTYDLLSPSYHDIDKCFGDCIHPAVKLGKEEVVEWILSMHKKSVFTKFEGKTPLELVPQYCHFAGKGCSERLILALFDSGGHKSIRLSLLPPLISHMVFHGHIRVIQRIMELYPEDIPFLTLHSRKKNRVNLFRAAIHEQEECVKYLVKIGADIKHLDSNDLTVLDAAILYNNNVTERMIRTLIELGVDINNRGEYSRGKGHSTLHKAITEGRTNVAIQLIKAGADLQVRTEPFPEDPEYRLRPGGHTALHLAMYYSNVEVIDCLLEAETDVTTVDNAGITASDIQLGGRGRLIKLAEVIPEPTATSEAKVKYKRVHYDTVLPHMHELPFFSQKEEDGE